MLALHTSWCLAGGEGAGPRAWMGLAVGRGQADLRKGSDDTGQSPSRREGGWTLGPEQVPSPPALACPPMGLSPRHWVLSGGTRLHPCCQTGPSVAGNWSAGVPRGGPALLP